ncbi:MAG: ankyrin repeat domain-containing protein [Candidatus Dependentiae bacterium]|nr:ankyrin repeat domain-containing protein [Candidatus Dependentiae bacterium]
MSKQSHRSRYTDIVLILGSLVVVGGAVSMFHGSKKEVINAQQTNIDADATDTLPLLPPPPVMSSQKTAVKQTETIITQNSDTFKTYIAPLIAANNIQGIATIMKNLPAQKAAQLANTIISDKDSLLRPASKVKLILLLALNYTNLTEQSALFDIFLAHKEIFLEKSTRILFIAAKDLTAGIIPSLLSWAKIKEGDYPNLYNTMVNNGLKYTISKNKPDRLETMIKNGVPINSEQATELLWAVIEGNRSVEFISVLKQCDANLDDIQGKYTPLTKAIANNNEKLVQALIDAGASINMMPSPEIGSPLQEAMVQKNTAIELLLRKYGAQE